MRIFKKAMKALLYFLGAIFAVILIALAVLWLKSPGTAQAITDENGQEVSGSISTIETIMLGGIEQSMIIRGKDRTNPVMLFLHGGPGSPEYAFIRQTNLGLEDHFVMVYWEQRGSGKSFAADIPLETMTLPQFVADTKELSEVLITRFDQDKIFLMGHSWGTVMGVTAAQQYPELYHAYFGLGQVGYQYEGERLSLEWAQARALEVNDTKAIEALSALALPTADADLDIWLPYIATQRRYLDRLGGGVVRDSSGTLQLLQMIMGTPEYTMTDKLNYLRGSLFSITSLKTAIMQTNLIEDVPKLDIPVFILQGAFDYQTPYPLARAFYDQLESPQKAFYTFENSAHSPNMEEPERFNTIVREHAENILSGG